MSTKPGCATKRHNPWPSQPQSQRERDKLKEDERHARLLAYSLKLEVFKGTAERLERIQQVTGIDEVHDLLTRLIHNAARLDDAALRKFVAEP